MKWKNRKYGEESPYIPAGPFKVRLPFVHYRFEYPDYVQGLLMCAVDLSAIPILIELLGMPFEVALAIVILNGLFYLLHHLLGDPAVPGWITPAIPLIILYCQQFPEGPERVHALIAFQMTLGILSIVLGSTGLATKVVKLIPSALKSGIILGAGLGAVVSVFEVGGRFESFPWTITITIGIGFYLLFSKHFINLQNKNILWKTVAKLGVFPVILLAVFVAPLFGEAAWPTIEWGFSKPDFVTLWSEYTMFGIGFPPLILFLTGLPTVLAAYIVLFGDVLQTKALIDEGVAGRPDEKVDYNSSRAHLVFGIRNSSMSIIGPDVTMAGPLWSAMQVVMIERFKKGRKAMNSIFGGVGSFRWGTNTGLLLLPIVSLVEPILGVAMALTLLIQGYVSVKVGILESKSQRDLGIAGIIGAVLVIKGAAWAFAVGIILCALIYGKDFFKGEVDKTFLKDVDEASEETRKSS
ncbi:membrane protein [Oceanobacillus manasiensis]|uniref:membrane protein n=1 Tax=Oceanobacillus manasiensis TaxID=586413 RepID=UPI0005A8A11E|nr:membrane protein [Oceanobacillus manasiensis]